MCSVVGCNSWRRSAQRFKLPEDPERRLEWVQFLATVNKQRFKESSWTDITICREHFKYDCFVNLAPAGTVQLTPDAVPSLFLQSESDEPEPGEKSTKCAETVETTEVAPQCDQHKTCDRPSSFSEESRLTSMASQEGPVPRGVLCSTHITDTLLTVYAQMKPKNVNIDLSREKAALLKMKGKYVVNEKRLLQLFSCKCPSCGCKLQMEKVTHGVLIIVNQLCLQCEYRNQWRSQVSPSVPTAEDQYLTGEPEIISEAVPADDAGVSEIVAVIDEESDPMGETEESSDQGDIDSDEDWMPVKGLLLQKGPEEESEDEEVEEDDDEPPLAAKHSQLCTECGMFFNKQKPHTCEHKTKPYSCNICGKRCVSEVALTSHSRIHNDNYEHRCKYCHVTFKTKVDKITHEQIHLTQEKPYKCPDCSKTFARNKECKLHLEDHRGPKQLKCHICGIEFLWPLSLQRHLAVHTGEKPFKCSVCQRGFNQASHLKSHMRLHTGERPYKCQHCDKSFNHNVSLKSHVQRYHTSSSGSECKRERTDERASDDGQDDGNKRGADSGLDNVEEEQDTEEEKERIYRPKTKRRTTGRPIGRPKNYASSNLVLAIQLERPSSNTKNQKLQVQKLKRTRCSDEESQDEQTDCDMTTADSAEEEGEKSKKVTKSTAKSRGRPKYSESDSDFDPEDRRKKRHSGQNRGKSCEKRRGRPRKNLVV